MDKAKLTKVRKAATQDFLVAYELRKKLAQMNDDDIVVYSTPEEDAAAREECARHVRPFDGDVSVGQVRVLSGVKEITYALVARKWGERSWLVIPFSSYASPATDTELRLNVDGGLGLRVVQLWNARSLMTETLAKSWLVHTLSDEDVTDVISAWQWSVGVGELSEDQLARTGMPVTNRKDPRIEYQDASLANFAKLDAEDLAISERMGLIAAVRDAIAGKNQLPFVGVPVFEKEDYALAAAGKSEPVIADCRVEGFDGLVHVRYDPATKGLRLRVFGSDGSKSRVLDGWSVFGTDAEFLGNMDGPDFVHEFKGRFDGVLNLVDEDGAVYPLSATMPRG